MVSRDATHHRVHVSLRLHQSDAGLEARDDIQIMTTAVRKVFSVQRQRHPQTHFPIQKLETGRHHTDDGKLLAVQQNLAVDDLSIAAITRLPQAVTEQRDLVAAGAIFLRQKSATELWLHAKDRKEIRRDGVCGNTFGLGVAGDVEALLAT